MIWMPSLEVMKSVHAGGFGVRTLTCLTRERTEVGSWRISWWHQRIGRRILGSRAAPVYYCTVETVAKKKDSLPFHLFGHKSSTIAAPAPAPSTVSLGGASMMVTSALKQSASVASSEGMWCSDEDMDKFADVSHKLADAAGVIIRQLFRTKIDILDKDDSSPVTVADRRAEHAMSTLIKQHFPSHAIYGEESGLHMPEGRAEYVWVLDPIDGTKSFITGKPLFGTLIALVHKGVPILGIIDQPVLRERWVGRAGKATTLNDEPIATRSSTKSLEDAYLYTTSPHLFDGSKEAAFNRVRDKVKTPLYGCDCYAYGLLAAGYVDLVIESGLKPYDFLALIPVIEGAGGYITDWEGKSLTFWPTSEYPSVGEGGTEVAAAGSAALHRVALEALDWK